MMLYHVLTTLCKYLCLNVNRFKHTQLTTQMDTTTFTNSYLGQSDEYRESASQWAYKITRDLVNFISAGMMVYGILRTSFALEAISSTLHAHHINACNGL